ncbi:MAG: hypothetical protein NT067_05185 [Candidatus Diapherotrites archaeon]|nr:hypothetical protein [Candidatus Diapherotrites archaeon]
MVLLRKSLVFFCAGLLLAAALFTAGCNAPPDNNGQKKEFSLYYAFEKGSALFNTITVSVEDANGAKASREIRTMTTVKEAGESISELRMLMVGANAVGGSNESICASIPYASKKSTVKFHSDGNVEYGGQSSVSFHLPAQKVAVGGTWEFEGIEYTLEGETAFNGTAGDFNCVKITFDGVQSDSLGTKRISGYFLFDAGRHLKIMEETTEERPGLKTTYSSELTAIKENFSGEPDYSCLFASEAMTAAQKYWFAERRFAENNLEIALELSLAAKQEFEKEKDLNEEELAAKKNNLMLLADIYKALGLKEKEIGLRLANADYFSQFLAGGKKISANEFVQAWEDYKKASVSGLGFSEEAGKKLADLNARITGTLKGKALLTDTGKTEGLKILLSEGSTELGFESEPFGESYAIPVLDLNEGGLFSAIYYRTGYVPQALPPQKADKNVFAGEYSYALSPMDNNALGYLAGFCYSLDAATGEIKQFNEERFPVLGDSDTFQAECKNGFYSLLLPPGAYTIPPQEKAYEVRAAETTIANYAQ